MGNLVPQDHPRFREFDIARAIKSPLEETGRVSAESLRAEDIPVTKLLNGLESAISVYNRIVINEDAFLAELKYYGARIRRSSHNDLFSIFQHACLFLSRRDERVDLVAIERLRTAVIREWERRTSENDFFIWPNTDVPLGLQPLGEVLSPDRGMLSVLGYHVGITRGRPERERRYTLDQVFTIKLPPINGTTYMERWGSPKTALRLKKMATALAWFTKNAKGNKAHDLGIACAEWEADLKYLHDKYYVAHFHFDWPSAR